jgi:hypothetical protein
MEAEPEDPGYRIDFRQFKLENSSLEEVHGHIFEVKRVLGGHDAAFLLAPLFRDEGANLRQRLYALVDWVLRFYGSKAFLDVAELNLRTDALKRLVFALLGRHTDLVSPESSEVEGQELEYKRTLNWCLQVASGLDGLIKVVQELHALQLYPDDILKNACACELSYVQHQLEVAKAREDAGGAAKGRKFPKDYMIEAIYVLLQEARRRGYRHIGQTIYEEQKIEFEGVMRGTRTFKLASFDGRTSVTDEDASVEKFVHTTLNKEKYAKLWEEVTFLNREKVVSFLKTSYEKEFPVLKCDRDQITYRNGVLFTKGRGYGLFEPWDCYANRSVGKNKYGISSKFVDGVFCESWRQKADWFDIPTPDFQSVLDYQNTGMAADAASSAPRPYAEVAKGLRLREAEAADRAKALHAAIEAAPSRDGARDGLRELARLYEDCLLGLREATVALEGPGEDAEDWREPEAAPSDPSSASGAPRPRAAPEQRFPREAQRWVYVFLGRLLHELNCYDKWQVIPFFKGLAGTGKSVISKVAENFFEYQYIGVLSSNAEAKFALYAFVDKNLFICPEVKKDFSLSQGEFQSMVSGESMSIPVKHQKAQTVIWSVPGLLCGNEFPSSYHEASGCLRRRIAVTHFSFPVCAKDSRPQLADNIMTKELGALIFKCNYAYRQQTARDGFKDIWSVLPKYYIDKRDALQVETDPLMSTLFDRSIFEPQIDAVVDFENVFMAEYKRKWKQIKGSKETPTQVTEDSLRSARGELPIAVFTDDRPDPRTGVMRRAKWLQGLRYLVEEAAKP